MRVLPAPLLAFLLKEWLLAAAAAALAATSLYLGRLPRWSLDELEVLALLAALLVAVRGLELGGVTARLARHLGRGRRLPFRLVMATFLLSMAITNDVALLVMVPLALATATRHRGALVILQALAANAGSALTPFGNPQNLFLYWHYGLAPGAFVTAIAPFSVGFGLFLGLASLFLRGPEIAPPAPTVRTRRRGGIHALLLFLLVLVVLRLLPPVVALAVPLYALAADRRVLAIDYPLLALFFCFFGFTDNLGVLLSGQLEHPRHVFLLAALASQVMSNVPAALLLADFTDRWQDLLWGVSVGGFGSLVASLANLIAWRIYLRHPDTGNGTGFSLAFMAAGYAAFLIGLLLYRTVTA